MDSSPKKSPNFAASFSRYGIYFAFVLLTGYLAITSPYFRTFSNFENILQQISVNGIMAVGMTLVIITGGIDLSVGSVLALSAVVATSCVSSTHHEPHPLMTEQHAWLDRFENSLEGEGA